MFSCTSSLVAGSVQILVNKKNYSLTNFTTAQTINDSEITWSTTNKTKLSVAYESGAGAVIDVLSSQLSIQVTSLPEFVNRTIGLLGVNNDDTSDDLTRPDGTTISINSTQEEIYYKFGMLCMLLQYMCACVCFCTCMYVNLVHISLLATSNQGPIHQFS